MDSIPQKQCTKCKQLLPSDLFHFQRDRKQSSGLRPSCKVCDGRRYTTPKPPDGFKKCSKCEEILPATLEYFYKDRSHADYLSSLCKPCKQPTYKKFYPIHPEGLKICSVCGVAKPKTIEYFHPDRSRLRGACRECHLIKSNSPESKIKKKIYRQLNGKSIEQKRRNNPKRRQQLKVYEHKRRTLEISAEGSFCDQDLQSMYVEQECHCAYCGQTLYWSIPQDIHVEHITPLSRGGSNWPDNICLACADCNHSKGNKTVVEWIEARGW